MAAVALRIWGIVLLLSAAAAVPGALLMARAAAWPPEQADAMRATMNASMFQLGASVILALCLLIWAEDIARWAIPETPQVHVGVDTSQLLTVGLVLVGVGILIQGLGDAAASGYALTRKPQGVEIGTAQYLWERKSETLVRAAVNVVAGILLVLGRTGLIRAWAQIRSVAQTGHGLTKD